MLFHERLELPFSRLELTGNDVYLYSTTLSPSLLFSDVDFSGA